MAVDTERLISTALDEMEKRGKRINEPYSIDLEAALVEAESEASQQDPRRFWTGIECLDQELGPIRPGDLVLVAARPGEGKTAIAENIAMANSPNWTVDFATLELPRATVLNRMLAKAAHTQLDDLERIQQFNEDVYQALRTQARGMFKGMRLYRPGLKQSLRIDAILADAKRVRADLLIIDYTRRIDGFSVGENPGPSAVTQTISEFAKTTGTATIVLAQLKQDYMGKRPDLGSVQDTTRLEQEADKVLFLFRPFRGKPEADEPDDITEAIIAKNRRGGYERVHLRWDGAFIDFSGMTLHEVAQRSCCGKHVAKRLHREAMATATEKAASAWQQIDDQKAEIRYFRPGESQD